MESDSLRLLSTAESQEGNTALLQQAQQFQRGGGSRRSGGRAGLAALASTVGLLACGACYASFRPNLQRASSTPLDGISELVEAGAPASTPAKYGCLHGTKVKFTSHRGQHLVEDGDAVRLSAAADTDAGSWWTLLDASGGHVHIFSNLGKFLSADRSNVVLRDDVGVADNWKVQNAGQGRVFLNNEAGTYLADIVSHPVLSPNADDWEVWTVTTGAGDAVCSFHPVTLFCFMTVRERAGDHVLLQKQSQLGAGIFGCDERIVFSDVDLRPEWQLEDAPVGDTVYTVLPFETFVEPAGAYLNSKLFKAVWSQIAADGRYRNQDWTVKTDADVVFLPDRLRIRIGRLANPEAVFFANCAAKVDVQAEEHPHFMYGHLEVFSKEAVETFFEASETCEAQVGFGENMWEERYMTNCLVNFGATLRDDMALRLLSSPHCNKNGTRPNCAESYVSFANFSTVEEYEHCWRATEIRSAGPLHPFGS